MSEFKEKTVIDDEIIQAVSGGTSGSRTCKCTLCDKTFTQTAYAVIILHLSDAHKLSKDKIAEEYNKIKTNYVN